MSFTQTLLAPVVTTLLFLAVFSLAIGSRIDSLVGGVPFMEFLAPGLIMMAIAQNALYGFIGYSDAAPLLGVAVMACVNTALWILCRQMFKSGYKLKA